MAKATDKDIVIEHFGRVDLDYFGKGSYVHHQRVEMRGGSNWFESC